MSRTDDVHYQGWAMGAMHKRAGQKRNWYDAFGAFMAMRHPIISSTFRAAYGRGYDATRPAPAPEEEPPP